MSAARRHEYDVLDLVTVGVLLGAACYLLVVGVLFLRHVFS